MNAYEAMTLVLLVTGSSAPPSSPVTPQATHPSAASASKEKRTDVLTLDGYQNREQIPPSGGAFDLSIHGKFWLPFLRDCSAQVADAAVDWGSSRNWLVLSRTVRNSYSDVRLFRQDEPKHFLAISYVAQGSEAHLQAVVVDLEGSEVSAAAQLPAADVKQLNGQLSKALACR